MLVGRNIRLNVLAQTLWKRLLVLLAYSALFVFVVPHVTLSVAIPSMLGTALSILLGFRTNSSYARWWEARKVWGGMVNDSRTFGRQVVSIVDAADAVKRELVHRQIAFAYVLRSQLRGLDPLDGLDALLSNAEVEALRTQKSVPNAMLLTQARRLREVHATDSVLFLPLDETLTSFTDHMGKCERIKNTVFPTQYAFLVRQIIWLFTLLLPPALAPNLGWITLIVAPVVCLIFTAIEILGDAMQDPFDNKPADTPMTALSRTIEINLRQQLGETNLPPKLSPVDGVLM